MKILVVTNLYPTASHPAVGTFVEQQVKGLREIGLDIEVLLLDRAAEGPVVYRQAGGRARARFEAGRHDLMHVMYGGVMADLVTRAVRDVPTVITIRGSDILGERLSPLWRLSARVGVFATRRSVRRADRVIAVSPNLRDALPNDLPPSKVKVIPNGVDLQRFRPMDAAACRRELGWTGNARHVLFVTNGSPRKRPELARAAVSRLGQLGMSAELHEMRGVPHPAVPTWINASDVLLMTSMDEGSPNIVKECLACNVPVVSVDVGDVRERVEGIAGCRIAEAEAAALATALYEVCSSHPRVDSRVRMAGLSLEGAAERIREVYGEAVAERATAVQSSRLLRV